MFVTSPKEGLSTLGTVLSPRLLLAMSETFLVSSEGLK